MTIVLVYSKPSVTWPMSMCEPQEVRTEVSATPSPAPTLTMVGRNVVSSPDDKHKVSRLGMMLKPFSVTSKVDVRVAWRDELLVYVVADIIQLREAGPGHLIEVTEVGHLDGLQEFVREVFFALLLRLHPLLKS